MEVEKADNENKSNNSDLLATDPCNKDDKENGKTSVQSKSETSETTSSFQNYANPDKIANNTEGFGVGVNKEQGNINLESETDNSSGKEEQWYYSFERIDPNDFQATENENQAENPKTQSTNPAELENDGNQTSNILHPGNSYERVFDCKQGPFNSQHIASVKRQLHDRRKRADLPDLPEPYGRARISKGEGDVTVSRRSLSQAIIPQEQEEKNTRPRHGAKSSSTSSTYSSKKSKTSDKRKLGEEGTPHEDTLFGATTSKVDGTDQNLPRLPDTNQSYHSFDNSSEGKQKDDNKPRVSSATATTDRKKSLNDSKDNSLEANRNLEDMFGSEHAPVREHEIEQVVNSSLIIAYAETNQQKENTAHTNPEKINTEEETTTPEAEALKITQKEITNKNAPMQEYNEKQDKAGNCLDENKKRVADKEEVYENKNTSNMDVRYKYKNKKNGNSSQSDTSSEDQNLKKDSSTEFKGEIYLNVPQINNPANNIINSEEGRQQESISKNTIHSPNSNNLDDNGTRSVTLNKNNKLTQTEQNLKEELLNIFECQKCSERSLNISNLQTRIEDLTKEILKKYRYIKQLEQENLEKDKNIKELHNKTSEMEECKFAIESLLKDFSIKKSAEPSRLWNFLIGNKNKADKDGTINAINQIKSHIQKLEDKLTGQQYKIEDEVILISTYAKKYNILEKEFEKKVKDQLKILEDRDTEIKELTEEKNMKEKYYSANFLKLSEENDNLKNQLKKCKVDFSNVLKNLKKKDKELADLNCLFNTQISTITNLQNEKWKLEHKITTLENYLRQAHISLQTFESKNSTLESHLDQACKKIKKFEEELRTLRNTVEKEEFDLKPQKEALQIYLNRISDTIQIVCEPVSQEENAKQTDKPFINNVLERIRKIQQDVDNYENQIREFEGSSQSKTYLHIKDILVRTILQLDNVPNKRKEKIVKTQKVVRTRIKYLLEELKQNAQQ